MPHRIDLLGLSYIRDCDTNMYYIGEIDGGLHETELDSFLRHFGEKGYNELIAGLDRVKRQLIGKYLFISTRNSYRCCFSGNIYEFIWTGRRNSSI